jgi:hypothetical protein
MVGDVALAVPGSTMIRPGGRHAGRKVMAKASKAKRTAKRASKSARAKKPTRRKRISEEEMMALWQQTATPGELHRRLEPLVGTFKATTTIVMEPGAPPSVSDGVSEHRWALGGRWLEQRYRGAAMGMPFEGLGFTGYDNTQKKYVGTWMDTFSTGVMNSVGVGRPSRTAMDFDAEAIDCTGKRLRFETKLRIKDGNRHTYEMWMKAPNGKRFRTMLVEYTRA